MIKKIKDRIPVPVTINGDFDLDKQAELADKYEQIEQIKQGLISKLASLTETIII